MKHSEEQNPYIHEGPLLQMLEENIRKRLTGKKAKDILKRLHLLQHWSWDIELVPKLRRPFVNRIALATLFSFFASFSIGRTYAYLVTFGHIPDIFLNIRGVHVHHFVYGILVLAISGFLSLIAFSPKNKIWLALLYGIGLGLAADEAGQWLRLQDDYWVRQSYDAIIIVSLILLFIMYLPRYLDIFYRYYKVGGYTESSADTVWKEPDPSQDGEKNGPDP